MLLVLVSLSWLGGPDSGGISLCASPSAAVDSASTSRRTRRRVVRGERGRESGGRSGLFMAEVWAVGWERRKRNGDT